MPETITKGTWTKVAFGDVIQLSKERSKDPEADGLQRYIGLEHIEPGDLRIRSWGHISDGITFTNVFHPGQVLFGKRRAYQRKIAVADFSGVCSGDIYVLEPKNSTVLPELLPFICQTDAFFEHAIATSAGSLSPRTNWKSLAEFEFALPPLEEQRRIVEVLQAAERARNDFLTVAMELDSVHSAVIDDHMRGRSLGSLVRDDRVGEHFTEWPIVPLGDVLTDTQYGLSIESQSEGQYPILRMMNLKDGLATEEDLVFVDLSPEEFSRYRLEEGDVLFNRTNSHELVGRTAVYRLQGSHVFASYIVRLNTKEERLLPSYLCAFLNAPIGRRQVMSFATRGVSQTNVNASNLHRIRIPLPPIGYQERLVQLVGELHRSRERACDRSDLARRLVHTIMSRYQEQQS
jgi:restriction endonuclease S subunit